MPTNHHATEPRFYVYDRAERQDSSLSRWSAVNCRYWIIDRTTNLPVDETTTKRGAVLAAKGLLEAERDGRLAEYGIEA